MVKFKEYFQKMCAENKVVFDNFQFIHDLYKDNKKANQVIFNEQGLVVRKIVEDWDRKLCGRMERGVNATYSARLSEKFWGEVRIRFPLIDFVGATIK
ncbi:MAG: hypothetical protein ACD_40C00003G0012 [uncultured bacterium]|nr:MAG: hypothetical protein ACD_40C00003G0012 [uncultured bacterium]